MTEAQHELVQRANKRLEAARYLLEGGFLDDAVSRAYYAMAFMAEAALLEHEITPKTHKGLQTQFGKQFVTTDIFPAEMGRNLRRTFDLRQMADYTGTDLTEDTVRSVIEKSETFVRAVETHLEASESET